MIRQFSQMFFKSESCLLIAEKLCWLLDSSNDGSSSFKSVSSA
jgi:hypothetical protein